MNENKGSKERVEIRIIKTLLDKLEGLEEFTTYDDYYDDNRKKCLFCGSEDGHSEDCFWTEFLLYKNYIGFELGEEVGVIANKGWED